ncbi:RecX family transcriptional regulator [Candidatus Saccharibacteria bacterium]|nr:RecX family transcriptional regulator [Candidatus Saccharibacteria bacterium]
MEIYSLKDDILDEKFKKRVAKKSDSSVGSSLKITDLKQGVKNPNRVNIYVNENFAFSLDVAQVVDFKLKIGKELSKEELTVLKKESEFGKLYQRTLEWVLLRPRSKREVKDYLARKYRQSSVKKISDDEGFSREEIADLNERIFERLKSKGYLDDRKFAVFYVENRFVKKGISKKRLKMELMKKGVALEIIDEVLDGRDDEEEIKKIIAKKRAKYDDDKLMAYLMRQGFDYGLVKKLVMGSEF